MNRTIVTKLGMRLVGVSERLVRRERPSDDFSFHSSPFGTWKPLMRLAFSLPCAGIKPLPSFREIAALSSWQKNGYDCPQMSTRSAVIEKLARHLLAMESAGDSRNGSAAPALRACEKLRVPLTKLAGAVGFSSLLSRALALAKRQDPSLEGLRVDANGVLSGFDSVQQAVNASDELRLGEAALIAELLGLLVTFIGESLMLRLLREAWPEISITTMTLNSEDVP